MTHLARWMERYHNQLDTPPAPEVSIEVLVSDVSGAGIPLMEVSITNNVGGLVSSRYTDGNGYCNHAVPGNPGDLCTLTTSGYKFTGSDQGAPEGPQYYRLTSDPVQQIRMTAELFKRGPRPVPPVTRPPLPPFVEPVDYLTTLPWTPPPIPTRNFLRGDAWGVTIPGAPWVPGASSKHPERILSWFLDRYSADFQKQYLELYAGYGYTHLLLSYADSCGPVDNGPQSPPGNARTLDQFIETCRLVKQYVPFCKVMIGSKYFQPKDMSAQQWADFADPILLKLFEAKAADEVTLGWEWNLWNVPGDTTITAFQHAGQLCHEHGVSFWQHYSPHVTAWFADGSNRFDFYGAIAGDVDGIDYQTDPYWSMSETQARCVDTLWQFGERGNDFVFRFFEDQAVLMFDNDHPDEDDANLRGYNACCTIDNVKWTDAKVWGFGNGARMPDGTRL